MRADPAFVELAQKPGDMAVALPREGLAQRFLAREQQPALVDLGAARHDGAALVERRAMGVDRLPQRDDAFARRAHRS